MEITPNNNGLHFSASTPLCLSFRWLPSVPFLKTDPLDSFVPPQIKREALQTCTAKRASPLGQNRTKVEHLAICRPLKNSVYELIWI